MDPVVEQDHILSKRLTDAPKRLSHGVHYFEQVPFIWAERLIPNGFFLEGRENEGWYNLLRLVGSKLEWNTPVFIESRHNYFYQGLKELEKYIGELYWKMDGSLDLEKVLPIIETIREFLKKYPFLHDYLRVYRGYFSSEFCKPLRPNYGKDYQNGGVESYAAYLYGNLQAQERKKWHGLDEETRGRFRNN